LKNITTKQLFGLLVVCLISFQSSAQSTDWLEFYRTGYRLETGMTLQVDDFDGGQRGYENDIDHVDLELQEKIRFHLFFGQADGIRS
jgi:hypothetical protein